MALQDEKTVSAWLKLTQKTKPPFQVVRIPAIGVLILHHSPAFITRPDAVPPRPTKEGDGVGLPLPRCIHSPSADCVTVLILPTFEQRVGFRDRLAVGIRVDVGEELADTFNILASAMIRALREPDTNG